MGLSSSHLHLGHEQAVESRSPRLALRSSPVGSQPHPGGDIDNWTIDLASHAAIYPCQRPDPDLHPPARNEGSLRHGC